MALYLLRLTTYTLLYLSHGNAPSSLLKSGIPSNYSLCRLNSEKSSLSHRACNLNHLGFPGWIPSLSWCTETGSGSRACRAPSSKKISNFHLEPPPSNSRNTVPLKRYMEDHVSYRRRGSNSIIQPRCKSRSALAMLMEITGFLGGPVRASYSPQQILLKNATSVTFLQANKKDVR